jgi:hypothetical protein
MIDTVTGLATHFSYGAPGEPETCQPDCAGLECGPDGCGDTCPPGCGAGETCNESTGTCECAPDCTGKQCGDDGCGGDCGTCGAGETCNQATGTCDCAPDCADKQCGDDGCGGDCGTCDAGQVCSPAGACVEDTSCSHDRECPPDMVCAAGTCVAGSACSFDFECDPSTEYCHPDGGVCKQRSALCEPCTEDYECPDPAMGDMCIFYPDGDYCGQRCGVTACPAGYDCDLTSGSGTGSNPGQCRSNTGSCEGTFICHGPGDCAANQVCNPQTGQCVPMCADDIQCPGGQKCHLSGHCGPPCAQDSDCAQYGSDLICCTAPGIPSQFCDANSTGKCRPDGCALHSECLQTQGDSLGYCDKRTHTCMPGCRAADPASVNDCVSGMKCECTGGTVSCDGFDCCPDPGAGGACLCDPQHQDCSQVNVCDNGECLPIPCNERGDVNAACSRNQLCCGWPLADGYPCPAGVGDGECYTAPGGTWCSPCADEGGPCEVTGYGHGQPGACLRNFDDNLTCHLACRDDQDCPSGWQCDYNFVQGCNQQTDCEATALCDVGLVMSDGTELKMCMCQTDSDCPAESNGFQPHCVQQALCDYSQDPPDCSMGMVCKFAKVCQCLTCCTEL